MLRKISSLLLIFTIIFMLAACNGSDESETDDSTTDTTGPDDTDTAGITELNILWAQWDPADFLQEIGNKYEEETGIKVNVIQEPWGSFGDLFFTEMAALLAAVGAGAFASVPSACEQVIQITGETEAPRMRENYQVQYEIYRSLYPILKETFYILN